MANTKITSLTELSATPDNADYYVIVDTSDTLMAASGTNKKLAASRILHQVSGVTSLNQLGIGTVTPATNSPLHIYASGASSVELIRLDHPSETGSPLIGYYQQGTRRGFLQQSDSNDTLTLVSEYGDVAFKAASSAGSDSDTEYMRIKAGGNVGIGTVTPSYKLEVNGTMQVATSVGVAWANFAFNTGWGNYGGGWQTCQYKKFGDLVFLRGLAARSSGVATLIATLPTGFRPPLPTIVSVDANGAFGSLKIDSNGELTLLVGSTTYVTFETIVFSTI